MIEYIRGIVDEVTPTQAVIEASGVGYALSISLNTYTAIQNKKEARLFVYEVIREDAYLLFGFATRIERDLIADLQLVRSPYLCSCLPYLLYGYTRATP